MPRLLWRDAQGIEGSLDLTPVEIRVGRAMDCAIRTDDAMVSRHHARVYWGGAGYLVEDLSSANGVYFQEQRVQNHLLQHGDAVRCGSLWLRFVDGGPGVVPVGTPMMQAPGLGPTPSNNATGHISAMNPQLLKDAAKDWQQPPTATARALSDLPPSTPPNGGSPPPAQADESDAVRILRRRIEQMQTELRSFRAGKSGAEPARRIEQLENEVSALEIERDGLKARGAGGGAGGGGDTGPKVQKGLELAAATAEAAAGLNDVLSALRIEVMAAEGALDQHAQALPRPSFELIRQSLRDAAAHCDEARDMLRRLRDRGN